MHVYESPHQDRSTWVCVCVFALVLPCHFWTENKDILSSRAFKFDSSWSMEKRTQTESTFP